MALVDDLPALAEPLAAVVAAERRVDDCARLGLAERTCVVDAAATNLPVLREQYAFAGATELRDLYRWHPRPDEPPPVAVVGRRAVADELGLPLREPSLHPSARYAPIEVGQPLPGALTTYLTACLRWLRGSRASAAR